MTAVDPDESHPEAITLGLHDASPQHMVDAMAGDVVLEMGWGRLIFGQTFADPEKLAGVLRQDAPGRRDICIYAREPHVLVARAPAELFIDPSHTYRLRFSDDEVNFSPTGFTVRTLHSPEDADAMNRCTCAAGWCLPQSTSSGTTICTETRSTTSSRSVTTTALWWAP